MARRRNCSVRRRKQRGGDGWFSKLFGTKPPTTIEQNQPSQNQPTQKPAEPQPPSKKYKITTSEAATVIKLSNKLDINTEDRITIGTIIIEEDTQGDSMFKNFKVLGTTVVKIPINYINPTHGFVEVEPMTGGRRSRRRSNRSRRSTRKQRR